MVDQFIAVSFQDTSLSSLTTTSYTIIFALYILIGYLHLDTTIKKMISTLNNDSFTQFLEFEKMNSLQVLGCFFQNLPSLHVTVLFE